MVSAYPRAHARWRHSRHKLSRLIELGRRSCYIEALIVSFMTDTLWSADANPRSRPQVADRTQSRHAQRIARLGRSRFCAVGLDEKYWRRGKRGSYLGRRRQRPILANRVNRPKTLYCSTN